ncbi:MAG TPA: pseudouridine synthase [Erysipelothrix sp.]|nr:pseudouridine synthase [Erysipelothrix sp.]
MMKKAIKLENSLPVYDVEMDHEVKESYRLNKYISDSGYTSRRAADRLIEAGLVTIDNKVAIVGQQVFSGQQVRVEGNLINKDIKRVYIALHKPVGITCTTDRSIEGNIVDFMDYGETIFPIGRLDKDSSGLILLTNDGDIVNKILLEEYGHDKEYEVTVDKKISNLFAKQMENGVEIYNPVAHTMQTTLPCKVLLTGKHTYNIILKQGLNRQIRRMAKALGAKVVGLKRIRIMHINLDDLPSGHWRYLSQEEMIQLNKKTR